MKKSRLLCLIICFLLLIQSFIAPAAATGDASVTSGSHSVEAAVPLGGSEKLLDTSRAVLLYEMNSDTLVYGWNIDQTIYPSSMVKLMTALVAIEQGNLEDTVTVTRSALDSVAIGSVSAGLKRGEELSLEALLYCMMAASANDAAAVIAEHIAGSQDAFIQLMNDKAKEIGCNSTNYSNVTGLHDEQTYTTARDICRLLIYALDNEVFETLFTARSYTVPATNKSEERTVQTSNYMMSKDYTSRCFDERVTGGKTGSTDQAGRCLAVTAEVGDMRLLGIVMGAVATYEEEGISLKTYGNFEEMKALLDYAEERFEYRQVFYEGQALKQYPVSGGTNHVITMPVSELSTVLPAGLDETKLVWVYDDSVGSITAPVQKGQKISTVQVWYENVCLAQTDIVAVNDVAVWQPQTEENRIEEPEPDWTAALVIVWIAVGIIALFVMILLLIRGISTARMKARQRRRRQQRRRTR